MSVAALRAARRGDAEALRVPAADGRLVTRRVVDGDEAADKPRRDLAQSLAAQSGREELPLLGLMRTVGIRQKREGDAGGSERLEQLAGAGTQPSIIGVEDGMVQVEDQRPHRRLPCRCRTGVTSC